MFCRHWFGLYLFLVALPLAAQPCDGILSPVLFGEDFGAGTQPGPALPPGTTTYNCCAIGGGNYIVTNTTGLNGSLWHRGPDHTPGDTDGYMLLFDAAGRPDTFYRRRFDNLEPETNYLFTFYVANVVNPSACSGNSIEPEIGAEFRQPGIPVPLAQASSGPLPTSAELSWREIAFSVRTATGQRELDLSLYNRAPGGCGNDLAIDDLSFRVCESYLLQEFSLCDVDRVIVGDRVYDQPGRYRDTLRNGAGQDSVVVTLLRPGGEEREVLFGAACTNEGFTLNSGRIVFESGRYFDTLAIIGDCPEVQPYDITISDTVTLSTQLNLCELDSVLIGGVYYDTPGIYYDTIASDEDCVFRFEYTVTGNPATFVTRRLCRGDTFSLPDGRFFTESIVVTDTLDTDEFCPEVTVYRLSFGQDTVVNQSVTICPGGSLRVGTSEYRLAGRYSDLLLTDAGCDSTVITELSVAPIGVVWLPPERPLREGDTYVPRVAATGSTSVRYRWEPAGAVDCPNCAEPTVTLRESFPLTLSVTDTLSGCTEEITQFLRVQPCAGAYVPNAFSPNGDGVNDRFTLYTNDCFAGTEAFAVYDRWGALVFSLASPTTGDTPYWDGNVDGRPAPTGTYVYAATIRSLTGRTTELIGAVTLLR